MKNILIPLELWCPKTWFKAENGKDYDWGVWQQGF
jgi:hypothetical protein